ncbi:helix-turn-helix transcriptional regulator [Nonomuraea sp. NPDC049141]|uniref:helix-turn-helix domain-containing protein n=1 Tax=Nonomuraea sp. NPDC049141 TaxID=3155500 RepID=UPI0033F12E5F
MTNEPNAFAEWVSAVAKSFGYKTDAQLAAAIGVQQSTVTRWRSGNRPQVKHLVELARLFSMKIDPLLAMSGHVPADLLNDASPPGPPMTESVRRIRDASLSDFQKEALSLYWEQRLDEERHKLYTVIAYLEGSEDAPKHDVGTELLRVIAFAGRQESLFHLTDLMETLVSVEAAPRKRRRRGSRQDELTVNTVPQLVHDDQKARLELE